MAEETREFQAEVAKLLDIVVHSLYSNRDIFLRELISNASDACDRLRYVAQTQPELLDGKADFRILITADKEAGTLTIADNGIGMNREDLIANLGTIAKSGTADFLKQLGDSARDSSQIGQFGVGFYSAFMVAKEIVVKTRKAGESQGWRWSSDGLGKFTVTEDDSAERGACVTLTLRDDAKDFLEVWRIRQIVKTYSDHIDIPVYLVGTDGQPETTPLNTASALWTRPKSEVSEEQYKEFYHHVAHDGGEPWLTLHYRAEGVLDYTALLYIPAEKPFDLFHPERKQHVKLYVKRVFITDDAQDLLPPYLRFLRGVVDSQDLPLNVSREMLQHNPILAKIRSGLVKRVLAELKKKATEADSGYLTFWENFGAVLKEGLYDDYERKDDLLALSRFRTTAVDGWTSLDDIVGRMKEGQEDIFYAIGDDATTLRNSPQLEGFIAKGIEVLLLTDPIDEFWIGAVGRIQEKQLRSVNDSGIDLNAIKGEEKSDESKPEEAAPTEAIDLLVQALKLTLDRKVVDVRTSDRLTNSAVCLAGNAGQMSIHMERLLKAHHQMDKGSLRILEINPRHPLIGALATTVQQKGREAIADDAFLLLDQANIVEGEAPADPLAFAQRLAAVMAKSLG